MVSRLIIAFGFNFSIEWSLNESYMDNGFNPTWIVLVIDLDHLHWFIASIQKSQI